MRWLTLALALALACAAETQREALDGRYDREQLDHTLATPDNLAGLVLGEFALAAKKGVVDGDTIKVDGLDASLRLLGLDCEETFKSEAALRAYEYGFDTYLAREQAKTDHPVKIPTPLGMDAKHFAEDFFADVTAVRLERDHPKDVRDRYNRLLAYVFARKHGEWVNYNVECIRAGMSPYFTKYGRATRFDAEMIAAQDEARAARRGIWDPAGEHYRDYPLRLAWWDARAAFVEQFERETAGKDNAIVLTHWDALHQLEERVGDEVELLGTIGDIRRGKGNAPTRVLLGRRMFSDFPLVFFDDDVFTATGIEKVKGEFVRVRGTVRKYAFKGKRGRAGGEQLQIVIDRPEQIRFVDTWTQARARIAAESSATPEPSAPEPTASEQALPTTPTESPPPEPMPPPAPPATRG